MCTNPFFRLADACYYAFRMSKIWKKRIRNGALFLNYYDYKYVTDVYNVPADKFQKIPCGKCQECRIENTKQWASRAVLEGKYYSRKSFITLTYDDEHLPVDYVKNPMCDEVYESHPIVYRDFQLFAKRLRFKLSKLGIKIRIFGGSEYGDLGGRPHFHAIIYGYDFPDKIPFFWEKNGRKFKRYTVGATPYFISDELAELWGKGYVLVAAVTPRSCRYVASYQVKQSAPKGAFQKAKYYNKWSDLECSKVTQKQLVDLGAVPAPKLITPRRPGLARRWYDEHYVDIYAEDRVDYGDVPSRGLARHIKYFDNLYKLCAELRCPSLSPTGPIRRRRLERLSLLKMVRKLSLPPAKRADNETPEDWNKRAYALNQRLCMRSKPV